MGIEDMGEAQELLLSKIAGYKRMTKKGKVVAVKDYTNKVNPGAALDAAMLHEAKSKLEQAKTQSGAKRGAALDAAGLKGHTDAMAAEKAKHGAKQGSDLAKAGLPKNSKKEFDAKRGAAQGAALDSASLPKKGMSPKEAHDTMQQVTGGKPDAKKGMSPKEANDTMQQVTGGRTDSSKRSGYREANESAETASNRAEDFDMPSDHDEAADAHRNAANKAEDVGDTETAQKHHDRAAAHEKRAEALRKAFGSKAHMLSAGPAQSKLLRLAGLLDD